MDRAVPIRNFKVFLLLICAALAMSSAAPTSAHGANEFTAGAYPATVHGSGNVGIFTFTTNGGNIECFNTFHGNLAAASPSLKLAVTYSECKAFGFLNATVKPEGCEFVLNSPEKVEADKYKAHVDLVCPAGKSLKVTVSTCAMEYKPQTGLTSVELVDDTAASPNEDVTMKPEVTGVKYTVTLDGFGCPFSGTGEKTDGQVVVPAGKPITMTAAGTSFRVGEDHKAATHAEATTIREDVEKAEHSLSTAFPNASKFTSGKYPAIVHGSSAAGVFKMVTEGGSVQCANTYFAESAASSSTLDVVAIYEGCSAFGFPEASVNTEGCGYRLHAIAPAFNEHEYTGRLAVKCGIAESIKVIAGTCEIEVKEQGPLSSVKLVDDTAASPVENVTMRPEVKSLKYRVTKDGTGCPFAGTGDKTTGELSSTANVTLTAQSPPVPSEKIAFRVGEPEDLIKHKARTHTEETHKTATEVPRFQTGFYPATIHGSGTVGVFAFTTNGGKIECQNNFHGSLAAPSTTMKFSVTYTECKAFGFINATVNAEGCQWVMHATKNAGADKAEGSLSLECPVGKAIKVSVATCAAEIKPQSGLSPMTLVTDTAASPDNVTFTSDVTTGGKYTVTADGFGCPLAGTGEKSDGHVTTSGAVTLTAVGTDFKVTP